jgi:hypothetical protein
MKKTQPVFNLELSSDDSQQQPDGQRLESIKQQLRQTLTSCLQLPLHEVDFQYLTRLVSNQKQAFKDCNLELFENLDDLTQQQICTSTGLTIDEIRSTDSSEQKQRLARQLPLYLAIQSAESRLKSIAPKSEPQPQVS